MFGKGRDLTREDIDSYQSNSSARQALEEEVMNQTFDRETLDGFQKTGLNSDAMRNLDSQMQQKFEKGTGSVKLIIGWSLVAAAIVSLVWWIVPSTEETYLVNIAQLEENEQVDELNEQEFSPTTIVETNEEEENNGVERLEKAFESSQMLEKEKSNTLLQTDNTSGKELFIQSKLPIYSRKEIPVENELNLFRKQSKELYIQDFKVVDYSIIRDEQLKLTAENLHGIPASRANREVEQDNFNDERIKAVTYEAFLEEALVFVKAEEYPKAIEHFSTLLKQYEDDVNANFYKGLSLYYLQEFEQAVVYLENAYTLQLGNFYEEALWFKAQSLLSINKLKAKEVLERIVREGGFYAPQAKEKIKMFSHP